MRCKLDYSTCARMRTAKNFFGNWYFLQKFSEEVYDEQSKIDPCTFV
ncbi:hypothetical protein HMPREF1325_0130 [Treponema socranskii subsp. socranskii VPI DR56BR1116 = ATCC 35536]|uniref:Uncharacterized protein n=1 Tax=Treponema socranskii subsp. socranskii VPI DR56BR1116 = ATCC 35536 TaxID=1125725 RepID=U1F9T4_TRESO|nr:hypothetical protein HMPREF1325_0130 [Treponema socranskii subsp. socranskii VPI DR56BR1116 = ATCC 35536]